MSNATRQRLGRILLSVGVALASLFLRDVENALRVSAQESTGYIHVATTGTDTSGCGSTVSPCRTIQYAVNLAPSGGTILVAEGTYTYSGNTPHKDCSSSSTHAPVVCVYHKHLTLLGGYSADNWAVADPPTNPTIIDGQDWYRGVIVLGWGAAGAQASLRMEGFTVRNGLAQGASSGAEYQIAAYGGGMFASRAPVVLRNLTFTSNQAIGGNTTQPYGGSGVGGGLALDSMPDGTSCTLEHLTFDGNEARGGNGQDRGGTALGGGFSAYDAVISASYITLTNNIAVGGNSNGSGWANGLTADALGGGASIHILSDATLQYVTAAGNQAIGGNAGTNGPDDRAGAAHGGALYSEQATMTVLDSDLRHNLVRSGNATNSYVAGGGGIMTIETNVTIERTLVISNTAKGGNGTSGERGSAGGGGAYLVRFRSNAATLVVNSVIADNYIEMGTTGTVSGGGGGGFWLQGAQADITHTTIAANRMGPGLYYGQAVLLLNDGASTPATANLSYSIVADHKNTSQFIDALCTFQGASVNLLRGLFADNDGNAAGRDGAPGQFTGLETMVYAESAGFISPGSPYYNYHIAIDSAARDQATGSTAAQDIDGQPRPYNNVPDIGADEYPFALSASPGDSAARLCWSQATATLAGRADHYEVLVICEMGANPPDQGDCGSPIAVGKQTSFTLTGLTNFEPYTVTVSARDSSGVLVASATTIAHPTDILVYLPSVLKLR